MRFWFWMAWITLALLAFFLARKQAVIEEQDGVIRAQVKVILMMCERACDPAVIEVCESVEPPEKYAPKEEI